MTAFGQYVEGANGTLCFLGGHTAEHVEVVHVLDDALVCDTGPWNSSRTARIVVPLSAIAYFAYSRMDAEEES